MILELSTQHLFSGDRLSSPISCMRSELGLTQVTNAENSQEVKEVIEESAMFYGDEDCSPHRKAMLELQVDKRIRVT
jgi:hypothetical protein